jgi:glucosamine--fructose-6-phosphate aminotransferase (isomerizing)
VARAAEHSLACGAGLERAVAATKTYVAELAAIANLVARLSDDEVLTRGLARLPANLSDVLAIAGSWIPRSETLVETFASADRMLVVSRGFNLPTALEIALKFKEIAGIFAEGYSSADLMHGPVALARPAVPVLVFRPNGPMGRAMNAVVERLVEAGSELWLAGGSEVKTVDAAVRGRLALPNGLPEVLTPLAFVIPGYLLAGTVALRRGMNPDVPDGLSKITRTT